MVTTFTAHITPFDTDRTVYIYLPDDWQTSGKRYPVLYMYDGHNLFFDSTATYGTCWGLKEYLDAHPNLIVVGVDCNHEGDERLTEYCPYTVRRWGGIKGTGAVFMQWLVNELKPYVDAHWPTRPERIHTGIGGSSMGGLMSLYSIAAHSDVFSKAACLSPSCGICMPQLLNQFKHAEFNGSTRIYISWGAHECQGKKGLAQTTDNALTLTRALQKHGIQVEVWPWLQVDGGHCEADWARQVPQFMKFLFGRERA